MSTPPPPPPYNPGAVPPPPFNPAGAPPGYQQYQQYPGAAYGGQPQYASFGARLGALIIDGLIGAIFYVPAIIALFAGPKHLTSCTVNGEEAVCNAPTGATIGITVLLGAVFGIAYLVIFCRKVSQNQSWGMKATGIRVVGADSGQPISAWRAFGWQIAHSVSGFICYLGYFWMLWDQRKQTWHDKIATTVVIKA